MRDRSQILIFFCSRFFVIKRPIDRQSKIESRVVLLFSMMIVDVVYEWSRTLKVTHSFQTGCTYIPWSQLQDKLFFEVMTKRIFHLLFPNYFVSGFYQHFTRFLHQSGNCISQNRNKNYRNCVRSYLSKLSDSKSKLNIL